MPEESRRERPGADDGTRTGGRPWRVLARRAAVVATSALLAVGVLGVFLAWVALRVPWEVPDGHRLTGPTTVTARDGTVLARFTAEVDRRVVPLGRISEDARNAVIATEDARFYDHRGVDPFALLRAVAANVATGSLGQGGSTLTQQYVKHAFVGDRRTLMRKVHEAVVSLALERQRSKDEILERYLNAVYFGAGAHGIEAAARTYFDVPAAQLTAAQGAVLAQLLPAPSVRNPRVDPEGARRRRDRVLGRMAELGMLSDAEAAAARRRPLAVTERRPRQATAPYFVAYVRRQLVHAYGRERLLTGALRVRTTLDLQRHRTLRDAVTEHLPAPEGAHADVDAGAAAVDPSTGDILALYGGRSHADRQFDNATQLHVRQAGSGFKPYVYVAALEQGIDPGRTYPAPAAVVPDDCPPTAAGTNPFTRPVRNAGRAGYGRLTVREGLVRSVNTVLVQLGCDVGPEQVVRTARRMGVRNVIDPVANISIGSGPTGPSPLDMASGFATLANDGRSCPARSILSVTTRDGRRLDPPVEHTVVPGMRRQPRPLPDEVLATRPAGLADRDRGRCRQVVRPAVARSTTAALQEVVADTTATRARIDRPQAGKTGTTDDQVDAWFTGYTPDLSLSVWLGHTDDGDRPLRDVGGFAEVYGGTVPALMWRDAARRMLAGVAPADFTEPGGVSGRPPVVGPARRRPSPSPTATASPSPDVPAGPTSPPSPTAPPPTTPASPQPEPGGDRCLLVLEC